MVSEDQVRSAFTAWCDAHKRAGFSDDAVVLVSPLGAAAGVVVKASLGDTTAIAEAYMAAVGSYNYKASDFGSEEEWACAAGAFVCVAMSDGRQVCAVATFDDCDGSTDEEGGSAWEVNWDRE